MIKKLIWIFMICLLGFAIWFLISSLNRSNQTEVYIIQETHIILSDDESLLKFHYFTNVEGFKLFNNETFIFLQNEDESFKFPIDIKNTKSYHNETYFDTLYYGYEVELELPQINGNYHLNKAYLYFERDNKQIRYSIGEVYVEYIDDYETYPFTSLEGIKKSTPHLSQILVDSNQIKPPELVFIGPYEAEFFFGDELLVINVPTEILYLFSNTYVKIIINDETYVLPQFIYFRNYELLTSGFYEKYTH